MALRGEDIDANADDWAQRHGLNVNRGFSGQATFRPLFSNDAWSALQPVLAPLPERYVTDHCRAFHKGHARDAVLVSAPYVSRLRSDLGDGAAISKAIWGIGEALGLRVRVGYTGDLIYDPRPEQEPMLSLVWWDPSRLDLPMLFG